MLASLQSIGIKAAAALRVASLILLVAAVLSALHTAVAQPASPPVDSFVPISDDEGLTHSDVRAIVQDRDGFIWFGTRIGGLVRYDGYELKSYHHDPSDPNSLGQVLWCLLVDRTGTMWVGTEHGLGRFDPRSESFVHFRHDPANPHSLSNDVVLCLAEDSNGTIWAGTRRGLCRLDDREKGRFTIYKRPQVIEGSLNKDTFRSIFEDKSTGLLWVGGSDGLAAFDPRTGAFASYINDPKDPDSLGNNAVNKVLRAPDGIFWALTEDGVNSFVPTFESLRVHSVQQPPIKFRRFAHAPAQIDPGLGFVRDGLVDTRNRLWLATRGGLQLFDRETGQATLYSHRAADRTSLSDNIVHTVFEDKTGNLWVGTYGGGVGRLRSELKPFRTDRYDPANPRTLSDDRVAGLAFDTQGRLWASTTNGLCMLEGREWTRFQHDPNDPDSLPINNLSTVATAPNGDIWAGSHYGGAIRFDGKRFHLLPTAPTNLPAPTGIQPFTGRQVNAIMADNQGGIWLAARAYGLDYLRDGRFHHYHPSDDSVPGNPTSNVYLGVFAENGDLWYVTENHGLVRFQPSSQKFTVYPIPSTEANGRSSSLSCIARSRDGMVWVGAANGLLKFDPAAGKFIRHYTTADGLPNNAVMTILIDRRGHVWAATAHGLADFNPDTHQFRVYQKEDGLPSDVFSQRAGAIGPDGRIYLGTRAGVVSFIPEELRDNPVPPVVRVTGVRWLGTDRSSQEVAQRPQWPHSDTLRVAPGQLGFSVRFAALDFSASEKNQYRYRLDGWTSNWMVTSARERSATFTALPPGRYTFRVQASNADGVWNLEGTSLPIIIEPHLWETSWFRVVTTLAAAGLIAFALQLRMRTIRRRNALLEEQVSQRTSELKSEIEVRQRAEAALRESHAELENRVKKRTAELATTNANLEAEIRERRNIEAQLRQSQKMEAIGQLAGGIAHDFNNLLTVILGQSELLSMERLKPELRSDAAREIKRAAQRAAKLTRQLLVFSRREPMRLAIVDLNSVVSGDIDLLRRVLGEDISLETSMAAGTFPVLADASMIEQLLLNLALNARDAMPHGGRLTISTSAVTLSVSDPSRSPHAVPGSYARVSVSDTGTGIPPDILARIFEPFFTTKERGKGTGLGLAISLGIVQQHRGWIDVDTQLGRGTTFHAWFPLQGTPPVEQSRERPRSAVNGNHATVLIVEDEVAVRAIATRVLADRGFHVIEASSGSEALEQWQLHAAEISILLTDIIMPGRPNGRELARQLSNEKPSLRVITMSGYDPEGLAAPGESCPAWNHIRKPFTAEDLLSMFETRPARAAGPGVPLKT